MSMNLYTTNRKARYYDTVYVLIMSLLYIYHRTDPRTGIRVEDRQI